MGVGGCRGVNREGCWKDSVAVVATEDGRTPGRAGRSGACDAFLLGGSGKVERNANVCAFLSTLSARMIFPSRGFVSRRAILVTRVPVAAATRSGGMALLLIRFWSA